MRKGGAATASASGAASDVAPLAMKMMSGMSFAAPEPTSEADPNAVRMVRQPPGPPPTPSPHPRA